MRLKQQFSLLASLLIILVIAGISTAFFIYERELLIREMKTNEINIFESFIEMSNEALSLRDELLLLNYINLIKKINKNIVYMIFTNTDGYMLSAPHNLQDYALKRNSAGSKTYFSPAGEEIYDIARPVKIAGKEAGIAQIGFSQDILKSEVKKTLKKTGKTILFIALFALGVSVLAAVLLANSMTRPIRKVIKGAKLIGEGDLEQRIAVKSRNEFGDMAEEFNKMALKLKELDEMKDSFISSVSHELKSPLYHIKGHIDLFLMENKKIISKESIEHFNVIKSNIKRLSAFISDILDLAKIKSRHMVVNKKACDLSRIATETISLYKPTAREKNISLTVSKIPRDIAQITCDTEKITQVLHNLLGNAFKFTPDGGKIEISAQDKGDHIEVCVCDSGIGIPENKIDTVFEKFKQVKENMDKVENMKGTGLGLAIVRGIIEAHGEKIRVESELNKGSRFIFTLNKEADSAVPDEKEPAAPVFKSSIVNKNILLIDDEKNTIEILDKFLTETGCKVASALSGREGIDLARKIRPDMIILDLLMPGMDGFEVMKRLKKEKETSNIPIIVLTTSASEKNREKCLSLGASECLDKSSYKNIIVTKIEMNIP